jgi:hypothetical protein
LRLNIGLGRLNMAVFFYIARAFVLLVCCISSPYRAKTLARWKKAPTYQIVLEIGGGLVGLLVLVEICYLIILGLTAHRTEPVPY